MTTSRIVRGTKGRIFIYVCVILIVTGIIACYNNTRVELEDAQKSNALCQQQHENLSTQLQVITDYKQRLEKSLKTEKAEYQQSKSDLEARANEEKLKFQKATDEAALKFNSLQQHYNLLETQHNDFKEECSKKQREQLDEINNLQAKLKEIHEQLKQSERERENSLEHLKNQIGQLKSEKENLQKQLQENIKKGPSNHNFEKEPNNENQETLAAPNSSDTGSPKPDIAKQVPIDGSEYKISVNNVGDLPLNAEDQVGLNPPENFKPDNSANEPVQVLPAPNQQQSSTPNSIKSSKSSLDAVRPLKLPTMTPETVNRIEKSSSNNNIEPIPSPSKKLPEGVVAPRDLPDEDKLQNSKGENDAVANFVNNRYRNVASEGNEKNKHGKERVNEMAERENGANEIFDVGLNDDDNVNVVGKREEQQKNHAEGEKNNKEYEADYDKFPQNEANLEENEDDDGDDYNHNMHKEAAIRN